MVEMRAERIARLKETFGKLLEEKFPRPGSTLDEIERVTEEVGRELERRIEEEAVRQEGCGYQGFTTPCECGQEARYVRLAEKHWLTVHGLLVVRRAYYYCARCQRGFAPVDASLGLDRGSTSLRVRDKIARVGAMVPFARGARELQALCEISVSAKTFARVAEGIGERIGEEARGIEQEILSGKVEIPDVAPERLYVTLDGAMLPLQEGWRECKIGAVYEASPDAEGNAQAREIEHVGTLERSARAWEQVYALAFRRGVERAQEVIVLGDGAVWIWKRAQEHFPGCTEIVDFYHASEHLGAVARVRWGPESPVGGQWLEARQSDLLEGRFEQVLTALEAWQPSEPEAEKLQHQTRGYFRNNRERMRYDEYRARGLHIGSGVAESSCRTIPQARLKLSGMRWKEPGAEAILQLRRLWLDAPDTDFTTYARLA